MIALVLVGVGAIVISGSYDEPRETRALGRNIPVNEGARNPLDLSAHNSPTLLRNPVDKANLVVANRIDSPSYSCALAASFDGGGRWNQTAIPAPRGEKAKCYAPDIAFGPDGTLYLVFVTLKGRANVPNAAWLSTSTDGGKSLSPPIRTPLGKRAFQVRVTADPQSRRRVYLTWLAASQVGLYKFTEPGNPIQAIRSDDRGRSWSDPVQVNDPARVRSLAPAPAIGPRGELYVLYLDLGEDRLDYEGGHRGRGGAPYDGRWQLVLARSSDRGATWKQSVV
ncbi:MAG: glycoside hydrolase, partial [Chloroflexota bacterium]|nr:glycoside hydrolase [Chloroflexota bacterium]